MEELNERLRKINLSLRQQARVSTMYAPGLTYAPRDVDSAPSDSEQGAGPSVSSASTATFNWQPLVSCSMSPQEWHCELVGVQAEFGPE